MFPVSTLMGGVATANIPDVCKVPAPPAPPVPTPFPNVGTVMQVIPLTASKFVKVLNQAVVLKASKMPMTNGDQAGVAGGVTSSQIMSECKYITYSNSVKIEGQNAVYHTCQTQHNGPSANTTGLQAAPSQTMVLVAP